MTVFVDRPAGGVETTTEFWRRVTETTLSPTRGRHDEFASFVPPAGDVVLKTQRTADGSSSSHLDLHVTDTEALAIVAAQAGATRVDEYGDVVVMRSPGGLAWCAVPVRVDGVRPAPAGDPGRRVLVDQVCIDIAPDRFDEECAFWSTVTGWALGPGAEPEYALLDRPEGQPVRFLLQRRGPDAAGAGTASHLDLACDDVDAATEAHLALGATLVDRHRWWNVLADPSGVPYCLTRRNPDTGLPVR